MKYWEIIKNNLIYFVVFGIVLLILISYILIQLFTPRTQITPSAIPSQSSYPTTSSAPASSIPRSSQDIPSPQPSTVKPMTGQEYQIITPTDQQKIDQDNAVGQLLKKLPYQENSFSLEYSFSTNSFTLALSPNNRSLGNTRFDQFLKDNGIQNRNWLYNLIVK